MRGGEIVEDRLRELIDTFRRIYFEELLTEGAERVAYDEGIIDGLELAMEVVRSDGKREDQPL